MLAVLLVAPFLAQADATIANVAIPSIREHLHASGASAQMVIGGYLIAYAVLLITGARLGQTHGYKRLFMLGVAVFGTASLAGGLAPSALVLVAARVLQGGSAAMMYPQTLTGIQINFSGRARTRAVGLFAMALAAGAVVGQLLGGILVSADIAGAGWRPIFLVNLPVCLVVLVAARRYLPSDRHARHPAPRAGDDGARAPRQVDLLGVAALSLAVLTIVVPLVVGPDLGWPVWTWVCLALGVPACWYFVHTQNRRVELGLPPVVDVAVIRRRPVSLGLLALLLATATYYALLFVFAQYVQQGLHRSALASGLVLIPWVAAFGAAGPLTRRLPDRWQTRLPAGGYLLLAAAYAAIAAVTEGIGGLSVALMVALGLGGLGLGIGFTTLLSHLTNAVDASRAPDISGVSTTTLQIGGALGVAAFGSIYFALTAAADVTRGLSLTAGLLAAVGLLAAGVAHLATRR